MAIRVEKTEVTEEAFNYGFEVLPPTLVWNKNNTNEVKRLCGEVGIEPAFLYQTPEPTTSVYGSFVFATYAKDKDGTHYFLGNHYNINGKNKDYN